MLLQETILIFHSRLALYLKVFALRQACITNWPEQSYLRMEIFGIFLHKGELLIQLPEQSSPKYHCVFLFSRKLIFCDLVTVSLFRYNAYSKN